MLAKGRLNRSEQSHYSELWITIWYASNLRLNKLAEATQPPLWCERELLLSHRIQHSDFHCCLHFPRSGGYAGLRARLLRFFHKCTPVVAIEQN